MKFCKVSVCFSLSDFIGITSLYYRCICMTKRDGGKELEYIDTYAKRDSDLLKCKQQTCWAMASPCRPFPPHPCYPHWPDFSPKWKCGLSHSRNLQPFRLSNPSQRASSRTNRPATLTVIWVTDGLSLPLGGTRQHSSPLLLNFFFLLHRLSLLLPPAASSPVMILDL